MHCIQRYTYDTKKTTHKTVIAKVQQISMVKAYVKVGISLFEPQSSVRLDGKKVVIDIIFHSAYDGYYS